jgi:hypothetical protein
MVLPHTQALIQRVARAKDSRVGYIKGFIVIYPLDLCVRPARRTSTCWQGLPKGWYRELGKGR